MPEETDHGDQEPLEQAQKRLNEVNNKMMQPCKNLPEPRSQAREWEPVFIR